MLKIYLIAGEASGDNIGANLMRELKKTREDVCFYGVGGDKMMAEGMPPIFPAKELSLMGFIEILPYIPKFLYRIKQTINHIVSVNPDVVITIDSPGFCFRVARAVKEKISAKLIHYVAPTVWAYKPDRTRKIAKIFDHLLVILPFEPPYFIKEGLDTYFVGYPAIENLRISPREEFRQKFNIKEEDLLLCLTPGSRRQEIKSLLPIFLEAVNELKKKTNKNIILAIPALNHLREEIELVNKGCASIILVDEKDKQGLFSSADLALTKSGTITTELAFYKLPMVVAHKVNGLSYWLLKKMIKIKYVTIINILAEKELIPELLQDECNAIKISEKLFEYLSQKNRSAFVMEIQSNLQKLILSNGMPSELAAKKILSVLKESDKL